MKCSATCTFTQPASRLAPPKRLDSISGLTQNWYREARAPLPSYPWLALSQSRGPTKAIRVTTIRVEHDKTNEAGQTLEMITASMIEFYEKR